SPSAAGRTYTTREMLDLERQIIERMHAGRDTQEPLISRETHAEVLIRHAHLSEAQTTAVRQIMANRDQTVALEGVAGAGKTTTLVVIREAAERDGYAVQGLAPTSRATQKVAEAGITS